jgi:hypothetical protein
MIMNRFRVFRTSHINWPAYRLVLGQAKYGPRNQTKLIQDNVHILLIASNPMGTWSSFRGDKAAGA